MRLKDRLSKGDSTFYQPSSLSSGSFRTPHKGGQGGNREKIHELCKQYNRGHCKFGANCKFEHKCSYCNKFGHTVLVCRKLIADKERNQ